MGVTLRWFPVESPPAPPPPPLPDPADAPPSPPPAAAPPPPACACAIAMLPAMNAAVRAASHTRCCFLLGSRPMKFQRNEKRDCSGAFIGESDRQRLGRRPVTDHWSLIPPPCRKSCTSH